VRAYWASYSALNSAAKVFLCWLANVVVTSSSELVVHEELGGGKGEEKNRKGQMGPSCSMVFSVGCVIFFQALIQIVRLSSLLLYFILRCKSYFVQHRYFGCAFTCWVSNFPISKLSFFKPSFFKFQTFLAHCVHLDLRFCSFCCCPVPFFAVILYFFFYGNALFLDRCSVIKWTACPFLPLDWEIIALASA
jgi:hypothetical protein